MSVLVDTHVLVWLAQGNEKLGTSSRARLEAAAAKGGIAVSAISFWEVAMLAQRGRISLNVPVEAWRAQVLAAGPIREIPVDGPIAIESVRLPGSIHGDPADRILVATARLGGCRLATRDAKLIAYGDAGHVSILPV